MAAASPPTEALEPERCHLATYRTALDRISQLSRSHAVKHLGTELHCTEVVLDKHDPSSISVMITPGTVGAAMHGDALISALVSTFTGSSTQEESAERFGHLAANLFTPTIPLRSKASRPHSAMERADPPTTAATEAMDIA